MGGPGGRNGHWSEAWIQNAVRKATVKLCSGSTDIVTVTDTRARSIPLPDVTPSCFPCKLCRCDQPETPRRSLRNAKLRLNDVCHHTCYSAIWVVLEQAVFLFLGPKARFMCGLVEDVGDRIMSSVAIRSTGSDGGTATGCIVCPGRKTGCGGGVARRCEVYVPVKKRCVGSRTSQAPATGTWCHSREIWSP